MGEQSDDFKQYLLLVFCLGAIFLSLGLLQDSDSLVGLAAGDCILPEELELSGPYHKIDGDVTFCEGTFSDIQVIVDADDVKIECLDTEFIDFQIFRSNPGLNIKNCRFSNAYMDLEEADNTLIESNEFTNSRIYAHDLTGLKIKDNDFVQENNLKTVSLGGVSDVIVEENTFACHSSGSIDIWGNYVQDFRLTKNRFLPGCPGNGIFLERSNAGIISKNYIEGRTSVISISRESHDISIQDNLVLGSSPLANEDSNRVVLVASWNIEMKNNTINDTIGTVLKVGQFSSDIVLNQNTFCNNQHMNYGRDIACSGASRIITGNDNKLELADNSCLATSFNYAPCPICGNDVIDGGEECDGADLGSNCIDLGFKGGSLSCKPAGQEGECSLDTSACHNDCINLGIDELSDSNTLCPGIHEVSEPILIEKGMILDCAGATITGEIDTTALLIKRNENQEIISGTEIKNCIFDDVGTAIFLDGKAYRHHQDYISSIQDTVLENIEVSGCDIGIKVNYAFDALMKNIQITGCDYGISGSGNRGMIIEESEVCGNQRSDINLGGARGGMAYPVEGSDNRFGHILQDACCSSVGFLRCDGTDPSPGCGNGWGDLGEYCEFRDGEVIHFLNLVDCSDYDPDFIGQLGCYPVGSEDECHKDVFTCRMGPDHPDYSTCNDGLDNERNSPADGCIDAQDWRCGGRETACRDLEDNDCDNHIDSQDSDCAGTLPIQGAENPEQPGESEEPEIEEPGSEESEEPELQPDEEYDEIDCDDPFWAPLCTNHQEEEQADYETSCTNGIDDDGDGLTDCQDPICAILPYCDSDHYTPDSTENQEEESSTDADYDEQVQLEERRQDTLASNQDGVFVDITTSSDDPFCNIGDAEGDYPEGSFKYGLSIRGCDPDTEIQSIAFATDEPDASVYYRESGEWEELHSSRGYGELLVSYAGDGEYAMLVPTKQEESGSIDEPEIEHPVEYEESGLGSTILTIAIIVILMGGLAFAYMQREKIMRWVPHNEHNSEVDKVVEHAVQKSVPEKKVVQTFKKAGYEPPRIQKSIQKAKRKYQSRAIERRNLIDNAFK